VAGNLFVVWLRRAVAGNDSFVSQVGEVLVVDASRFSSWSNRLLKQSAVQSFPRIRRRVCGNDLTEIDAVVIAVAVRRCLDVRGEIGGDDLIGVHDAALVMHQTLLDDGCPDTLRGDRLQPRMGKFG